MQGSSTEQIDKHTFFILIVDARMQDIFERFELIWSNRQERQQFGKRFTIA
jgi:hypothetical protein